MMAQDLTYGVCGGSFEYDYGYGEFEEQVNTNLPYNLYDENPNYYPNFSHQNHHIQYQQQPPTQNSLYNQFQMPQYEHFHTHPQQKDEPNFDIQDMILQMMGDQQNFFTKILEESQNRSNVLQSILTHGEELSIRIAQMKETQEKPQTNTLHQSLSIEHECEFEAMTFDEEDMKWEEPISLSSCEYESVVFDEEDMRLSKPNTLSLCEYEGVTFDVNIEVLEKELMRRSEAPIYDWYGDSDDDKPMEEAYAGYVSCNEEDKWSCEIALLEEPILEKFELCFHEEDEFLFPIDHEDFFAPTMKPMIVGDDMVDLLQKVKLSYKGYLVEKLKNKLANERACGDLAPTISTPKVSDHQCYENSPSSLEGLTNPNAIIITKK
ncbi:uncharacterized protein LOC141639058 [Silene latifolia]|uniref:uncharacterized protein LOC141639058 n=1 Tax=Silene latifolia TaxID=37657 RepID=UPI003D785929